MKILPQSLKIFRMNSVFIKLLLIFTGFILLSVLVVGASSYINSSKRLLQEVKKSNILILKQTRDSIDKELVRINDVSLKIALDKRVNKASYLTREETASNKDLYNDIIDYLKLLRSTSDISSNIWIRFDKSKKIVNFENLYDEDLFFNDVCVYKSTLDWEKLFHEYYVLSSMGRQEIYFNYASNTVIPFIRSIPVGDIQPMGTVVVNINEKVLSSVMSGISENNPILKYIIDSKNNIIFSNDDQYKYSADNKFIKGVLDNYPPITRDKDGEIEGVINSKKYTIEFTSSNVNDWRYISLIPNSFITSKVKDIRDITFLIMILSLIAGIIVSYILAKRVYDPINNIIGYLSIINNNKKVDRENGKGNDEFLFINKIINYVYNENEILKESFNKNVPVLKEKLLNDLLEGKVTDIKFKEISENIGLELPFNMFQVVVFEIDDYSNLGKNLQNALKQNVIESFESIATEVFLNNARV